VSTVSNPKCPLSRFSSERKGSKEKWRKKLAPRNDAHRGGRRLRNCHFMKRDSGAGRKITK